MGHKPTVATKTTEVVSSAIAMRPVKQAAKFNSTVLLARLDALGSSIENSGYL